MCKKIFVDFFTGIITTENGGHEGGRETGNLKPGTHASERWLGSLPQAAQRRDERERTRQT